MNPAAIAVVFVIWWWVAFLVVLPSGVRGRWESEDDGVAGADPGAPTDPRLKQKALRATAAAVVLTVVTALVIVSGVVNFRD